MNSGRLVYKCRRCNKLNMDIHVPNGGIALICIMNEYPLPKDWGNMRVKKYDICLCDNKNLGVSDLIGFEED